MPTSKNRVDSFHHLTWSSPRIPRSYPTIIRRQGNYANLVARHYITKYSIAKMLDWLGTLTRCLTFLAACRKSSNPGYVCLKNAKTPFKDTLLAAL